MGGVSTQGLARVRHYHLRQGRSGRLLHQRAGSTELLGLVQELVAVEMLALDGDEELAFPQLAGVLDHAAKLGVRALEPAAAGGRHIREPPHHGAASPVSRAAVSRSL